MNTGLTWHCLLRGLWAVAVRGGHAFTLFAEARCARHSREIERRKAANDEA